MNLKERYQKSELKYLVGILESPEEFTLEAVEAAIQEINEREADEAEMYLIAKKIVEHKITEQLRSFSPLNGRLHLPKSHFIQREEVIKMLKQAFEEWMSKREDITPDSWHYAIGAIL